MTTFRHTPLLLALLPIAALAAGCDRAAAPTPPAASAPAAASAGPQTALGRVVDSALDKARREMETGNISVSGDMHVNINGHEFGREHGSDGRPKAEISPAGDFLVDGKAVAITPAQRALLLEQRQQILTIASAGMAMGVKGADLAGKALGETVAGLFSGDSENIQRRLEAEGAKLEVEARKLCAQLPPMLATQQKLAASLPAYKPYATMTQEDVDDCGKHDTVIHRGDAGVQHAIRDEVRQAVREEVRSTVRGATRGTLRADDHADEAADKGANEASEADARAARPSPAG